MNTFLGHHHAVSLLSRELPPVALLLGPPSIGKWTLIGHLADHHGIAPADRYLVPDGITAQSARDLTNFASRASYGAVRLIAARLDGSSLVALTALLKTLEEPPPTARFILTSSGRVPPTIASRAHIYRLGALSEDDLRTVLVREGLTANLATRLAAGGGSVKPALELAKLYTSHRDTVLRLMRAVAARDGEQFHTAAKDIDDGARTLLITYLREAALAQPRVFTDTELFGLHLNRNLACRLLLTMLSLGPSNPRLGVRAALEPFLDLHGQGATA